MDILSGPTVIFGAGYWAISGVTMRKNTRIRNDIVQNYKIIHA